MKKLILLAILLLSYLGQSQIYIGYARHGKKTSAEIAAIDVSDTNYIYTAYDTDLGIEVINSGSGWAARISGVVGSVDWSAITNKPINLDLDNTDDVITTGAQAVGGTKTWSASQLFNGSLFLNYDDDTIGGEILFYDDNMTSFAQGSGNQRNKIFFYNNKLSWQTDLQDPSTGGGATFTQTNTAVRDYQLPDYDLDFGNIAGILNTELGGSDWQLSGGTDDQNAGEVPFTPYLTIAATDVQAAIQEVLDEATSGTDDQNASEVTLTSFNEIGATDVQAGMQEFRNELVTIINTLLGQSSWNVEHFWQMAGISVSSLTVGDLLRYNGSEFVNEAENTALGEIALTFSRVAVLGDKDGIITNSTGTDFTYTINAGEFEVGELLYFENFSTGNIEVAYGGGVTGEVAETVNQNSKVTLWQRTLDNWIIYTGEAVLTQAEKAALPVALQSNERFNFYLTD